MKIYNLGLKTDLIMFYFILFARVPQNIDGNYKIYYKKCYIQISPHNFDPACLLTICLLHSLNRSMWVAIFPQKATTTVCLGFFTNPSSMSN